MRYIGIDFGTKKVGIAFSDEAGTMGFTHSTLQNTPRLLGDVRALIAKEGVGAVVMGESRSLGGGENPVAHEARLFATQLTAESGLPVFFESELFTTQEARRTPEGVMEDAYKAVYAEAASFFFTSYLSYHGDH